MADVGKLIILLLMSWSEVTGYVPYQHRDRSHLDRSGTQTETKRFLDGKPLVSMGQKDNDLTGHSELEIVSHQRSETADCPSKCSCTPNNHANIITVDCTSKNLIAVPNLPSTALRVYLQNNNIANVTCFDFSHLKRLEMLVLSQNEIQYLENCTFKSQNVLHTLDVSGCYLKTLDPVVFRPLTELRIFDISLNQLQEIQPLMFLSLDKLKVLNLASNELTHIPNHSFYGLNSLRELSLDRNRLSYKIDTFESNAFQGLDKLEILNIARNQHGYETGVTYPDNALSVLTSLRYLRMDGVPVALGVGFRSLENLTNLDVSAYCNMQPGIPEDFLHNIVTEQPLILNMSNCQMPNFPPLLFKFIQNINCLDISYNPKISVDGFEKGSEFLANSNLTSLNITGAMKIHERVIEIKNSTFRYLKHTKLKVLILEDNKIYRISPRAIDDLPLSLEYLSIAHNNIQYAKFLSSFLRLSNLKTVDGSSQLIYHISTNRSGSTSALNPHVIRNTDQTFLASDEETNDASSENLVNHMDILKGQEGVTQNGSDHRTDRNLTIISDHIGYNKLDRLPNVQTKIADNSKTITLRSLTTGVERFQDSGHGVDRAYYSESSRLCRSVAGAKEFFRFLFKSSVKVAAGGNFVVHLPESLETVYANDMKVNYAIPSVIAKNNVVLRYVDYSGNEAHCWEGPLKNFPALQHLDLSRNSCGEMSLDVFKYLTSLNTLLLHQNFLGQSLADDEYGRAFSTLVNLQRLDLRHNSLKDLSFFAFANNSNLTSLLLSHNELNQFKPTLSNIKSLEYLDLSVNMLRGLSADNCHDLQLLKSRNDNVTVNIKGNPLSCSCEFLPLLRLLVLVPSLFEDVQQLNVTFPNGTAMPYQLLPEFLPLLQMQCLAQTFFTGILILFFLVVGAVLTTAIFLYNRWKMTYLFYVGQRRMHIGATPITFQPLAEVFIIYDQEDLGWRRFLQKTFLPRLRQHGVTYVLAEVDFDGGFRMPQLTGAIVGTKKTLVLLSKEIFEDTDRQMEMNLAIMHEISLSSQIIVPVVLDGVDVRSFPLEIRTFFQNQCHRCLKYIESEMFWFHLTRTLKDEI